MPKDPILTPPPERRIYCNRTLNLRSIKAVGFDMDYTLVHYRVAEWERQAYERARRGLAARGWPVEGLEFDPEFVTLGLILDLELGNIVKANRFGYVTRACHGTRMVDFEEQRRLYSRVLVDVGSPRWVAMDTLFSLSEVSLFAQLVDRFDAGATSAATGYLGVHRAVRQSIDEVHLLDQLKAEIMDDPDRFVELDPELPLALLDLKHAGKRLLVITNSEWTYTQAMLSYVLDAFLPGSMTWRDLFDLVFVGARKPTFWTAPSPAFALVDNSGLLRPHAGPLVLGGVYHGGHAGQVERDLALAGEEILYVGDHIYADVYVTKDVLRWRTALVVRELERELQAVNAFRSQQAELSRLMEEKAALEHQYSVLRVALQRHEGGYGDSPGRRPETLRRRMGELRTELTRLDARIAPLAQAAGELVNPRWGTVMRAGNDKSHLVRQIERAADVYMARVSCFLHETPFAYLRSTGGSLPHGT
ncbi:MAG: HAD-IG family 5'-nucleotidase [Polyangiaceae bacterium]|nr:HAD-IG family 5'-nucleotidase [Polyangiaceae bacterium]